MTVSYHRFGLPPTARLLRLRGCYGCGASISSRYIGGVRLSGGAEALLP